jgi:hypothetical protein
VPENPAFSNTANPENEIVEIYCGKIRFEISDSEPENKAGSGLPDFWEA